MDKSNRALRRAEIFEALDKCKINDTRESILVDKVISLEDSLRELQEAYAELTLSFRRRCVQVPF